MNSISVDTHTSMNNNINERFLIYSYQDLSIAILKQSPDNQAPAFSHSHPEYEFIIPITPIPYLLLEGKVSYGECGTIYPILSGMTHGIAYDLNNISYISIVINKNFLEDIILKINNNNPILFNHEFEVSQRLNILLNMFKEEIISQYQCQECKKHLASLICIELINKGLSEIEFNNPITKYPTVITVKETADYIINNLHKDITVDELASLCNLSRFYYIRMFKQCFGVTPHNYIIKVRLSVGKLLLENTNFSLTEISFKCGFLSSNHFSEMFRQKNKISPSEYRKTYNKNYNLNIVN